MMLSDRFERLLPELLDEVGQTRTPDYFDDLLQRTRRTPQRPAWSFPERWIPMLDIARQPLVLRRIPWRPIVVLALIVVLLAGLALVVGSQKRLPPPFGPAANGLVGYVSGGDLYTADPVTGASKLIVGGPGNDSEPVWSRDGTRLAFIRESIVEPAPGSGLMFAVDADGGHLTQVTPATMTSVQWFEFSPDGRSISIASKLGSHRVLTIATADGKTTQTLDVRDRIAPGVEPTAPTFRPPDGSEILFTAYVNDTISSRGGIYMMNLDGSNFRTLVNPREGIMIFNADWSPDGSRITYTTVEGNRWRVHVMSVADGNDVVLHKFGALSDGWATWSPDGSRLILQRLEADGSNRYVVVNADGSGPEVEIHQPSPPNGAHYVWSPDGTSIMAAEDNHPKARPLLWDPTTGIATTAAWFAESYPAWQRRAP